MTTTFGYTLSSEEHGPRELVDHAARAEAGGFEFAFRDVEYRWERWLLPEGLPADRSQTVMAGLTVRSTDPALLAALRSVYKGMTFGSSSQVTFVLD